LHRIAHREFLRVGSDVVVVVYDDELLRAASGPPPPFSALREPI
jgi:DNA-binding LacI/PurR family transcriptional regulator